MSDDGSFRQYQKWYIEHYISVLNVQRGGLVYDLFSSAHLPIICYLTVLLERRRKLQGGVRPGSPARILHSPWIPKPTPQRRKALFTHDAVVSTSDSRKTIQTYRTYYRLGQILSREKKMYEQEKEKGIGPTPHNPFPLHRLDPTTLNPTSCVPVTSENINHERFFSAIGPQRAPSPTQFGSVAYSNPPPLGLP